MKKIEIDYRSPARLDDYLVVDTQLIELKKASMVFEQRLLREQLCLSQANVTVVCVDLAKMKPIAIPEMIYQALQRVKKVKDFTNLEF